MTGTVPALKPCRSSADCLRWGTDEHLKHFCGSPWCGRNYSFRKSHGDCAVGHPRRKLSPFCTVKSLRCISLWQWALRSPLGKYSRWLRKGGTCIFFRYDIKCQACPYTTGTIPQWVNRELNFYTLKDFAGAQGEWCPRAKMIREKLNLLWTDSIDFWCC